jgi:hypothetical protein
MLQRLYCGEHQHPIVLWLGTPSRQLLAKAALPTPSRTAIADTPGDSEPRKKFESSRSSL